MNGKIKSLKVKNDIFNRREHVINLWSNSNLTTWNVVLFPDWDIWSL